MNRSLRDPTSAAIFNEVRIEDRSRELGKLPRRCRTARRLISPRGGRATRAAVGGGRGSAAGRCISKVRYSSRATRRGNFREVLGPPRRVLSFLMNRPDEEYCVYSGVAGSGVIDDSIRLLPKLVRRGTNTIGCFSGTRITFESVRQLTLRSFIERSTGFREF